MKVITTIRIVKEVKEKDVDATKELARSEHLQDMVKAEIKEEVIRRFLVDDETEVVVDITYTDDASEVAY